MEDTQLTVREMATCNAWTVPDLAVKLPEPGAPRPPPAAEPPPAARAGCKDLHLSEEVAFEAKHLNMVVGVRSNQRTASIEPGDGTTWRAGFSLPRHVAHI